jgi:hypothetical protein
VFFPGKYRIHPISIWLIGRHNDRVTFPWNYKIKKKRKEKEK